MRSEAVSRGSVTWLEASLIPFVDHSLLSHKHSLALYQFGIANSRGNVRAAREGVAMESLYIRQQNNGPLPTQHGPPARNWASSRPPRLNGPTPAGAYETRSDHWNHSDAIPR